MSGVFMLKAMEL